jgi:hypothetical protein
MSGIEVAVLSVLVLAGCRDEAVYPHVPPTPGPLAPPALTGALAGPLDADGDGYDASVDCDDADASVHPGAPDPCDGLDADCDGVVEEDSDSDGFRVCEECADRDPTRFPGAADPLDGVDQDCDWIDGASVVAAPIVAPAGQRTGERMHAADLDGDGDAELLIDASEMPLVAEYDEGGWSVSALGDGAGGTTRELAPLAGGSRVAMLDMAPPEVGIYDSLDTGWPTVPVARLLAPDDGLLFSVAAVGEPATWIAAYGASFAYVELLLYPADAVGDGIEPTHTVYVSPDGFGGSLTADTLLADAGDRDGDGLSELALTCCRAVLSHDSIRVVTPGVEAHVDEAAEQWVGLDQVRLPRQDGADVDGDGRPDLALGTLDVNGSRLQLVPYVGPGVHGVEDHALARVDQPDHVPASALDDVDGDGFADLVTLVPSVTFGASQAALYLGPLAGTLAPDDAARTFSSGMSSGWFRGAIVLADLDGDATLDLAVGAPYDPVNDTASGGVYVVHDAGAGL